MNFLLSEEQEQLLEAVGRYATEAGDAGARRGAFDGDTGFDEGFWRGLMEMGVGGVALPPERGGLGLEMIDLALVAEALGHAGAPGPFLGHVLAGLAISWAGDEAQKQRWLPRLAAGEAVGSIALTASEGSAPGQWSGELRGGRLSAERPMTPYAPQADVIVVGAPGGGLVLVEKGAEGARAAALDVTDRTRRLWTLTLEQTPCEPLAGASEEVVRRVLDAANVLLAADAFGGATFVLGLARDYANTRTQFGGPIGRFQGLKHQLANMAARVEPIRGLYWYAAHAFDHVPEESTRVAALAKAHASECFMQTARDAIEAHGGIGYTWDYDAQIWLKRAMFDYAFLGTPDVHRAHAARLAGWCGQAA
ncbi:MAG TPA: acyl-CoA dehydrogenase family protein [Caulobacteraceae bacterium]|nr:acyl-CoA dehydrogenase family protein [Caulobacteraceae bacterium]